jgi:isopenicillin-N N-acyltransferase-like protein
MNDVGGARSIDATEIGGEPRERGRAHGAALRGQVHAHIAAWRGSLERAGVGDPQGYVRDMLRETDFVAAIRQFAPDLLEETYGIAEGAGADPELVYALQLLDEEWAYRRRRAAAGQRDKCSSFAIVGSRPGPTYIGQNMDLSPYTDGHQALLRVKGGDAPDALVFTTAGMLGLMGVNAAGVGVCVNSLPQLASAPEGVPVAFVLRRLLQCRSLAEASDLALRLPHATNQHYVIAEAGAARSFEASADGVTEYVPPDPSRVLHTNHPLAAVEAKVEPPQDRANSIARLRSLEGRLSTGSPGPDDLKAALSSCDDPANPVCRIPDAGAGLIGFTTGSMISAIDAAGIESWVSPGPPSERGYSRFTLVASQPN